MRPRSAFAVVAAIARKTGAWVIRCSHVLMLARVNVVSYGLENFLERFEFNHDAGFSSISQVMSFVSPTLTSVAQQARTLLSKM
jgi:hypothetical protein